MLLLPINRALLPACLLLGGMLCVPPIVADPPAPSAANGTQWQKLVLQHVTPGQMLKSLKWDNVADLPAGVTRAYAIESDNVLFVQATPDGFLRIRDIVKNFDIAPRQVQVKMILARAGVADLDASGIKFDPIVSSAVPAASMAVATGSDVARFGAALQKHGSVLQSPVITTSNNVMAAISISGNQPLAKLPRMESFSFTFAVTPRVNSDDTVILVLDLKVTWHAAGKNTLDGTPAITIQEFHTLHTVRNRDTLVVANPLPGAAGTSGSQLLLFVTPTALPDNSSPLEAPGE